MRTTKHTIRVIAAALMGAAAMTACSPQPGEGAVGATTTVPGATTVAPSTTVSTTPLSSALGGDYKVTYGSTGSATIHRSGSLYTVSVKGPFKIEGATCTLPSTRVLATFSGTGTHLAGRHSTFSPTTCEDASWASSALDVFPDGSVVITSPSGPHTFVKVANEAPVNTKLTGNYSVTYRSVGGAAVHVSGDNVTLSVTTPFKIEGASCTLPSTRVLGTWTGTGTHFSGRHSTFSPATCENESWVSSSLDVNSDNTLTLTTASGPHLLSRTGDIAAPASPTLAGSYAVTYGSVGSVKVNVAGTTVVVVVDQPFAVEGSTCNLTAATPIATFTGTAPHIGGRHNTFSPTACIFASWVSSTLDLNTDNTITIATANGPHLLTRI